MFTIQITFEICLYGINVDSVCFFKILLYQFSSYHNFSLYNSSRASLNIPFPTKQHREQRASFKTIRNKEKETNETSIPRFIPIPCQNVTFSFWLNRIFFLNLSLDFLCVQKR